MADKDSSKKIDELEKTIIKNAKTVEDQANTIARLENDIKKVSDPNTEPRIIQRGKQKNPIYRKNRDKIAATIEIIKPEIKN